MEDNYHICKICGKKLYKNKISNHLLKYHNLTCQEYYHKYILPGSEVSKCHICGKPLSFWKLSNPYGRTCSQSCANISRSLNMTSLNLDPEFQRLAKEGFRNSYESNPELMSKKLSVALKNLELANSISVEDKFIATRTSIVTKLLNKDKLKSVTTRYLYLIKLGSNLKVGVYQDLYPDSLYIKRLKDYKDDERCIYDLVLYKGSNSDILNLEKDIVIKFHNDSIVTDHFRSEIFEYSIRDSIINYINDKIGSTTIEKVLDTSVFYV